MRGRFQRYGFCVHAPLGRAADNGGDGEVTVKHHIKSLRGKLGARNRVHAVCRANELDIR